MEASASAQFDDESSETGKIFGGFDKIGTNIEQRREGKDGIRAYRHGEGQDVVFRA
jgi:hypothetical protein